MKVSCEDFTDHCPPLSVWPHLFCGAGHEKRTGEQLKWSLTFRLYIISLCVLCVAYSFSLGRLPKVDLIILEGENVRPSVRPYIRTSVHKKFLRFE